MTTRSALETAILLAMATATVGCGGGDGASGADAGGNDGGGGDAAPAGPKYGFTRQWGSIESDNAAAIAVGSDLTMVATGSFGSTLDFSNGAVPGESRTAKDKQDVYITKLDSTGDYHWTHAFGGANTDRGRAVAVAADGSVYATGSFHGTVDFDPPQGVMPSEHKSDNKSGHGGMADVFVTKLSQTGKYMWTRVFGGDGNDEGLAIGVDAMGRVVVMGTFEAMADLDPGAGAKMVTSKGGKDLFVVRLSADGDFVSGSALGGAGDEMVIDLAMDGGDGALVAVGAFTGASDLGQGALTAMGDRDGFVLRLGADDATTWLGLVSGPGGDFAQSVVVGAAGVAVAGAFSGTVDFGGAAGMVTSAGRLDAFVGKLGAGGAWTWVQRIGGAGDDQTAGVGFSAAGGLFLAGSFDGKVDFDPGVGEDSRSSTGTYPDAFVTAFGDDGGYLWTRTLDATFEDPGQSLGVLGDGSLVFCGWFEGTRVDFDFTAKNDVKSSLGNWDAFVSRWVP